MCKITGAKKIEYGRFLSGGPGRIIEARSTMKVPAWGVLFAIILLLTVLALVLEKSLHGVDPDNRAETYLRRIVKLTGAKQIGNHCVLDVEKTRFYVHDSYVSRLRDVTNPKCGGESTCFYLQDMPAAERIATALLQLKNNPELFDGWLTKRTAFKANGSVSSSGVSGEGG